MLEKKATAFEIIKFVDDETFNFMAPIKRNATENILFNGVKFDGIFGDKMFGC